MLLAPMQKLSIEIANVKPNPLFSKSRMNSSDKCLPPARPSHLAPSSSRALRGLYAVWARGVTQPPRCQYFSATAILQTIFNFLDRSRLSGAERTAVDSVSDWEIDAIGWSSLWRRMIWSRSDALLQCLASEWITAVLLSMLFVSILAILSDVFETTNDYLVFINH